jgi:hypothetical protein
MKMVEPNDMAMFSTPEDYRSGSDVVRALSRPGTFCGQELARRSIFIIYIL